MLVLEGFGRHEMGFNIQDGMMMESIDIVYNCILKCSISFENCSICY